MIVTKAMAEKYLIKRGCFLIKDKADGGYVLHSTSINWKEGMEIYETHEECRAEINRRIAERVSSGNCARCQYKPATETDRDINHLDSLGAFKFGHAFRCQSCNTVWYKQQAAKTAQAYQPPLLDFLTDWSQKKLLVTPEWKAILLEIKNISHHKDAELYPAHVVLKNGDEIPCALISLERKPPPADWFNQSDWYYLDQVKEIKPSQYAYPYTIAKHMIQSLHEKQYDWIYIKDQAGKLYGFNSHAGIFRPKEFLDKDFSLVDRKSLGKYFNAITVFEPEERADGVIWHFTPPPKTLKIWGDLTE